MQFSNTASNRMSAAASVLMMRNISKMFLRARQALEFSHGLDPKQTLDAGITFSTRVTSRMGWDGGW
jgi:hypothetical protein